MATVLYGYWNGQCIDNRGSGTATPTEMPELDAFDEGNPIQAFVSNAGFLVFDAKVALPGVLLDYYRRARALSCGRCTPCRAGTQILEECLEALCGGLPTDIDEALRAAKLMNETSLCGIGLTSARAFIGAATYFKKDLVNRTGILPEGASSLCTAKCIEACPDHVNIPRYIDYVRDGQTDLAQTVLLNHYPMVSTCARVCVRPCEKACRRSKLEAPVAIRDIKRFVADNATGSIASWFEGLAKINPLKPAIAVVGAGPAGINCAYHLLQNGYPVDIYDADTESGGMALRGIPPYRLGKDTLKAETDAIQALGAQMHYGQKLGRDFHLDTLMKNHAAAFIGIGCAKGAFLGLPDEDTTLAGYRNGIDFLLEVEHQVEAGKPPVLEGDVAIVGCGNVAMDCIRTAKRIATGKVHLIYRRTRKEAPADQEEIEAALKEGVEFHFLANPVGILSKKGRLTGVKLINMELTEPDAKGRAGVRAVPGTEHDLPCDTLIAAIGQKIEAGVFVDADGVTFGRRGNIEVNASLETKHPGVFAGGDAATGPSTLISALAQGQKAAQAIMAFVEKRSGFSPRERMGELFAQLKLLEDDVKPVLLRPRTPVREVDPNIRNKNFEEADFTFSEKEARGEAMRCMRCYRLAAAYTAKQIPNS